MSGAVNLRAGKSGIICIKKYIPIDGWSRPIEIHAIRVDRLHIPSLTCRHDKVVGQIGIVSMKVGERVGQGGLHSSVIVLIDRKSTRLNSSHTVISYAVFCLKKNTCINPTIA